MPWSLIQNIFLLHFVEFYSLALLIFFLFVGLFCLFVWLGMQKFNKVDLAYVTERSFWSVCELWWARRDSSSALESDTKYVFVAFCRRLCTCRYTSSWKYWKNLFCIKQHLNLAVQKFSKVDLAYVTKRSFWSICELWWARRDTFIVFGSVPN